MKTIITLGLFVCCTIISYGQKSGVKGQLYWLPQKESTAQQNVPYSGLPLEIFVHQLTSTAEVDTEEGVIKKIYTPLVTRFFCKWNGSFKVKLPTGKYSVFVRYQNGFYNSLQDAQGNMGVAEVPEKEFAWVTIVLDYHSYH